MPDKDWKYYAVRPGDSHVGDGWVKLSGEVELTAADLAGLTGATLYPVTGNEKKWVPAITTSTAWTSNVPAMCPL